MAPPARRAVRLVWAAVLALVVLAGAWFRWAEFRADRSLWLDEAALALNIVHQPVTDLAAGRLTNDQVAPPGFLLATRAVTHFAGVEESSLRFLPWLASEVFLAAFAWLAWKRLGPAGAFAAAALAAASWPLLRYAGEFKQYSFDLLVALGIFAAVPTILSKPLTPRRAVTVALGGVAALIFSQPAVFLLAALGLMAWVAAARRRDWAQVTRWTAVGAAWLALLSGQFLLGYASAVADPLLIAYHNAMFLRVWPPDAFAQTLHDGLFDTWVWLTCAQAWWVWLALLVTGAWVKAGSARAEAAFTALALFWTALASALQIYPLVARLLLFLAPMLFWLVARGVDAAASLLRRRTSTAAAPALALLLLLPLWPIWSDATAEARHPTIREHLRPVAAQLAQLAHPGDLILVWYHTRSAFAFYWPRFPHADVATATVPFDPDEPVSADQIAARLAPLTRGHDHVWLVLTHFDYGAQPDNLHNLVAALRRQYPHAADFAPTDGTARGLVFSK